MKKSAYKQVVVSEHVTPVHPAQKARNQYISEIVGHYGHLFTTCRYCGWTKHRDYVCNCGVDTGYLEDHNGKLVKPLVDVFLVPEKDSKGGEA